MTATSLEFPGLAEQAARLAAGEVTAAELTATALGRAHASQPVLNAFRHLRDDEARAEAAEADRRLKA
ncbi:amidase, partial [Amycolatopsis sp. SID8362]|nr:amidase [Amycolatopsis sp. SID8362]NED43074.1 amidase [Amycolatopsis sp. SID8362]